MALFFARRAYLGTWTSWTAPGKVSWCPNSKREPQLAISVLSDGIRRAVQAVVGNRQF